ncbi:MAG TPA: hypothetical protein VLH08_00165 [Acidobacteriota bacterium]|nr:hypothetical protein [Acidobacteriota bacterium]
MAKDTDDMTDQEIRQRIINLAFEGNEKYFVQFREKLRAGLPQDTGVALRGSAVTNERYEDKRRFDADGKGTSDLDVTLIGDEVIKLWDDHAFYIPKLHTKPLCDQDPGIAPALRPLREELQKMMHRPVNFQATANFILFVRDVIFDQPYYTLIEPGKTS